MTLEDIDIRRKRLIYRSWHRGTREMDLILGRFADAHVAGLSARDLEGYDALLSCPDPDLYDWITGLATAEEQFESLISLIKGYIAIVRTYD